MLGSEVCSSPSIMTYAEINHSNNFKATKYIPKKGNKPEKRKNECLDHLL